MFAHISPRIIVHIFTLAVMHLSVYYFTDETLRMLVKTVEEMKTDLKNCTSMLEEMLRRTCSKKKCTATKPVGWPRFPLSTLAEFNAFEGFLNEKDSFEYAVCFLSLLINIRDIRNSF